MIHLSLFGGSWQYRSSAWFLIVVLLFCVLFCALAIWQLSRGFEKDAQIQQLGQDLQLPPQDYVEEVSTRLRQIQLRGQYLPYTLLLDNSVYVARKDPEGRAASACHWLMQCGEPVGAARVGYRVVTFFQPQGSQTLFAVERGWVDAGQDRSVLPQVDLPPAETVTIVGIPVAGRGQRRVLKEESIEFTPLRDASSVVFQRVQRIDLKGLQQSLTGNLASYRIYPAILILAPNAAGALALRSPLSELSYLTPQRHWGYALQWSLMAIVLLGLHLAMSVRKIRTSKK